MGKNPFKKRYIAFVDILGFRSVVERMSSEDRLFTTVRDALKDVVRQSQQVQKYRRHQREKREATRRKGTAPLSTETNLQMTAFSDCYVISEVSPAWHVLAAVQALGAHLLTEGILTRGAVVHGRAYHNGQVLFGPGINDAYTLEAEVAKYPRILVTDAVRKEVQGYHEGRWEGQLLKHDLDGCWFVNLLVPSASVWHLLSGLAIQQKDVKSHLRNVRKSLVRAWNRAHGNLAHESKVWWLIHRFNQVAAAEGIDRIERSDRE
jgi:hypothetical protein